MPIRRLGALAMAAGCFGITACSDTGKSSTTGAAGTATAGTSAAGTSAAGNGGAAGTNSAGAGGIASGAAGGGAGGNAGNVSGGAGSGGTGGASGGSAGAGGMGPMACAGHALSLAANTTGTEKDVAHALVSIELGADLPIGNADRTIEFWMYVKPTDWVAEVNEIYVYGTVGKLQQVGLDFGMPAVQGMPGNHASLGPYTDGVYDDDTGVFLGIDSAQPQWLHVAMTWEGESLTLRTYVNGALKITTKPANATPLLTTASPFYLGCNPPYYGCFNGLVDELRIWNVRRSDADIMGSYNKALAGNEAGLVGYYHFDDEPGSLTAKDSASGAGHSAHTGMLMAAMPNAVPTFVTPDPLPPVACP